MIKFTTYILILAISAFSFNASAQSVQDKKDVNVVIPDYYKQQADSILKLYKSKGFELLKANFVPMESGYEIPIILPLQAGTWYQFVFIGDNTNKLQEMRMYDYNEKMVIYQQKKWADVDGNIIDVPYIAKHTEYHMIKPLQENKKKKWLAGGFMLFKMPGVSAFKDSEYTTRK